MAIKAYILIETAIGKTREVAEALRALPGMQAVDAVTGPYDVIALLEAPDLGLVGDLIISNLHSIDGVSRTLTCLTIEAA